MNRRGSANSRTDMSRMRSTRNMNSTSSRSTRRGATSSIVQEVHLNKVLRKVCVRASFVGHRRYTEKKKMKKMMGRRIHVDEGRRGGDCVGLEVCRYGHRQEQQHHFFLYYLSSSIFLNIYHGLSIFTYFLSIG